MRLKPILWGLVFVVPFWMLVVWVMVGCAPTQPTRYESDPNHYPYYREKVEQGRGGAFVYGPDQRRNGFVSSDGRMVYGQQDGGVQFIAK